MTTTLGAERGEYRDIVETRSRSITEFEVRDVQNGTGGTDVHFRGYACVTGVEYPMEDHLGEFVESVERGAFKKTLGEAPDVSFKINHQGLLLARTKSGTLELSEDDHGLHVEARLDTANSQTIALRSAVARGDLDEMSFGFRVKRQDWNEDFDRRHIREVDIHHGDVSPVNFGANAATAGSVSIRQRPGVLITEETRDEPIDEERLHAILTKIHEAGELKIDELRTLLDSFAPAPDPPIDPPVPVIDAAEVARMKAHIAILRSGVR